MQKRIALLSITFAFAILFFSGAAAAANPNSAVTITTNQSNPNTVNPTVYVNTSFNTTTTVTNNKPTGTVNATNVNVLENIPTGIDVTSYTASTGTFNTANDIWTIGTVQPGDIDTLNLSLTPTATAAGQKVLSATLYQDINPTTHNPSSVASNNQLVYIDNANVTINPIFVSATTVNVGTYFYKIVTVTNNGPSDAFNLLVKDNVPTTLNVVNAVPSFGTSVTNTYNVITGTLFSWIIPFLASGHSATLQIGLTPNAFAAGTTVINTATLTNTYQTVTAPGVYVPLANVKLTKTVSNTSPVATTPFTYTVTAANSGPDSATTVVVKDIINSGLTYISSAVSQGTTALVGNTLTWTVGTIASGASAWLNITVSAPTAQLGHLIPNTATESQDQWNAITNSNTASASQNVRIVPTSLSLTKTVSNTTPTVTTPFSYTTTVTDNGALPVTNVLVNDPRYLPGSLGKVSYTGYTASTGTTYNPTTGLWTIPTLAVGASSWLTLDYTPTDDASGFNFTDTASVIQATVTNTVTHVSTTYPYLLTASATASVVPVPPAPVHPFVISTGPANGATGVSLNPPISINFNELIALGTGNVQVKMTNSPGTAVPYNLSINGSILTITLSQPLAAGTMYTVILHSGSVTDTTGTAGLAVPYTFRFTTT